MMTPDRQSEGYVDGLPLDVVAAVTAETGEDEADLPPLGRAVDTDAVVGLVSSIGDGHVSFEYHGFTITVDADRSIEVEPADEKRDRD